MSRQPSNLNESRLHVSVKGSCTSGSALPFPHTIHLTTTLANNCSPGKVFIRPVNIRGQSLVVPQNRSSRTGPSVIVSPIEVVPVLTRVNHILGDDKPAVSTRAFPPLPAVSTRAFPPLLVFAYFTRGTVGAFELHLLLHGSAVCHSLFYNSVTSRNVTRRHY